MASVLRAAFGVEFGAVVVFLKGRGVYVVDDAVGFEGGVHGRRVGDGARRSAGGFGFDSGRVGVVGGRVGVDDGGRFGFDGGRALVHHEGFFAVGVLVLVLGVASSVSVRVWWLYKVWWVWWV